MLIFAIQKGEKPILLTIKNNRIMKKLALLFACIFAVQFIALANNDKPIQFDQLPQASQQFVKTHFAGKDISMVLVESGIIEKTYDVIFANGDKVEFDRKGQWTDVECKRGGVPAAVLPKQISDYVENNHKGVKVVKIERDGNRYDVDLANGWDLTFNKNFKVVDIDR
jgi:hypothetical protein